MPVYLESFTLPVNEEERLIEERMLINAGSFRKENGRLTVKKGTCFGYIDNAYPCGIFGPMELYELYFSRITILYGGNGSGKSTLLNLIAKKLKLKRTSPHNSGELFDSYAGSCRCSMGCGDDGFPCSVPAGSAILTSDDVFDYMLAVRDNNSEIGEAKDLGKAEYAELKFGETVKLSGMEDYERLRLQVQARRRSLSRREFIRRNVGEELRLFSNGETALRFFEEKLGYDTLYCLDEPENSMAPAMQLQLAELFTRLARYCGCQLIIATHSPFLLSLEGARVYDLDSRPAEVKNWWELENPRIYFDFFDSHRRLFENGRDLK